MNTLRQLRENSGQSPQELARAAGINVESYYDLETYDSELKLPRFAGRVAKAYAAFFFSKQSSNASGVS
jgi:DNA-binding XRE family transcriptional regulator